MSSLHKCSLAVAIAAFIEWKGREGDKEQNDATKKKLEYCFRVLYGPPTDFNMESLSMEGLLGHMVREKRVPLIEDHSLFEEESNKLEAVNKKQKRKARTTLFDFLRFVFQQLISFDELPPRYRGEIDGKQQILWTSLLDTYVCPKILETPRVSGPETRPLFQVSEIHGRADAAYHGMDYVTSKAAISGDTSTSGCLPLLSKDSFHWDLGDLKGETILQPVFSDEVHVNVPKEESVVFDKVYGNVPETGASSDDRDDDSRGLLTKMKAAQQEEETPRGRDCPFPCTGDQIEPASSDHNCNSSSSLSFNQTAGWVIDRYFTNKSPSLRLPLRQQL